MMSVMMVLVINGYIILHLHKPATGQAKGLGTKRPEAHMAAPETSSIGVVSAKGSALAWEW